MATRTPDDRKIILRNIREIEYTALVGSLQKQGMISSESHFIENLPGLSDEDLVLVISELRETLRSLGGMNRVR
jgi:hypothetical protein